MQLRYCVWPILLAIAAATAFFIGRQADTRESRQKHIDLLEEHRDALLEIERLRTALAGCEQGKTESESQAERRTREAEAATDRAIKLYQAAQAEVTAVKKKNTEPANK